MAMLFAFHIVFALEIMGLPIPMVVSEVAFRGATLSGRYRKNP
jgi:hypothetical protein